jgi:uncharacterized Zn finger protein (UPF0148 family)
VRVECESCRELVVASFGIDGDTVRAACPACQHVMSATWERAAPPSDAPLCPKCGAPRRNDALACASCGLAVARWAAFSDARDAAVPEPVREAWTRATEAWNTAAPHDQLLQLAASHNAYAWAAGRYRTRRDTVSQRQLERLRRAAEATLFASATARPDTTAAPYRATRGVLAFLIVAVLVGVLYAVVIRDHPRAPVATPIPAQPLTPGHPVSPSTIK